MKKYIMFQIVVASMILILSKSVFATPFTIFTTLTGDPRPGNPDSLFVDVTIQGNTDEAETSWLIDINSPLHPDTKLDAFYFNLAMPTGVNVGFDNYIPSNWIVTTPATNAAQETLNPATTVRKK